MRRTFTLHLFILPGPEENQPFWTQPWHVNVRVGPQDPRIDPPANYKVATGVLPPSDCQRHEYEHAKVDIDHGAALGKHDQESHE